MLTPQFKSINYRNGGRLHSLEYLALEQIARENDGGNFIRIRLTPPIIKALASDIADNALVSTGKVKTGRGITEFVDAIQIGFLECKIILSKVPSPVDISPEFISALHRLQQWHLPVLFMPYGPGWREQMRKMDKDDLIEQIKNLSKKLDNKK